MADLIPTPALPDPPLTRGGATLALIDPGPVTSIALFPGETTRPAGLAFPAPGMVTAEGAARLVWTGRDQAFLIGIQVGDLAGAAVTDQSDGWACLSLSGPGAEAALARLVALDLREGAFPHGRAARSSLNHLPLILWREVDGFRLMVFRSMARTAWHEIAAALAALQARADLPA
ncbi:MAG: sarcosine oxidase subunit gamma [Gemmobacter sp.]